MRNRTYVPHFGTVAEARNARRTNITTRRSLLTFTVEVTSNPYATSELLREAVLKEDRVVKESVEVRGNGTRRLLVLEIEIPSSSRGRLDPWIDSKVSDIIEAIDRMQVPSPMAKPGPVKATTKQPVADVPQRSMPSPAVQFASATDPKTRGYNANSSKARRMTRKRAKAKALLEGNTEEAQRITEQLRGSRGKRGSKS